MVDLGLPQLVQGLKAQAWSDEVRNIFLANWELLDLFGFYFLHQV